MYKRIMIVVDDKPATELAIREGTSLAAAHGAEAVFLGLAPTYPVTMADASTFAAVAPEEFEQAAAARTEELLDGAMSTAERAGVMAHRTSSHEGAAARAIVELARRRRCDLIVVGADDRNAVMRLLSGSLVPGLITSSPVPVLVCKDREHGHEAAH